MIYVLFVDAHKSNNVILKKKLILKPFEFEPFALEFEFKDINKLVII